MFSWWIRCMSSSLEVSSVLLELFIIMKTLLKKSFNRLAGLSMIPIWLQKRLNFKIDESLVWIIELMALPRQESALWFALFLLRFAVFESRSLCNTHSCWIEFLTNDYKLNLQLFSNSLLIGLSNLDGGIFFLRKVYLASLFSFYSNWKVLRFLPTICSDVDVVIICCMAWFAESSMTALS